MTPIRLVTSFAPDKAETYGRRCIESIAKFWPDAPLSVVVEDKGEGLPPVDQLLIGPHWFMALQNRMRDKAYEQASERNRRKFQCFGKKVMALYHVFGTNPWNGWLIWIDADVEFTAPVTEEWIGRALPKDKLLVCLRREGFKGGVESSFVAYRVGKPHARILLDDMVREYVSGRIFKRDDWGDGELLAAMLDNTREAQVPRDLIHDLSAGIEGSNPFPHSILGEVAEHAKGVKRKNKAYGVFDENHPSIQPKE